MQYTKYVFDYYYDETEQGKERGYIVHGNRYPGVTSILGKTKFDYEKAILNNWIEKNPEKSGTGLIRGSWLHSHMENLFLSGEVCSAVDSPYYGYWQSMYPVARQYIKTPLLIEGCLWHDADRYAGSSDLICLWGKEEKLTLVDYKTAEKAKSRSNIHDYLCQVTAYRRAAERIYGITIDQCVILIATPGKVARKFVLDDSDEIEELEREWRFRLEDYWAAKGAAA